MLRTHTARAVATLTSICAMAVGSVVATTTPAAAAIHDCNTTVKYASGNYNGKATYTVLPSYGQGTTLCYLSPGDSGRDVAALQYTLIMCYGRDIEADGEFGTLTKEALKHAQRLEGITADGYYGVESRNALTWQRRLTSNGSHVGVCVDR